VSWLYDSALLTIVRVYKLHLLTYLLFIFRYGLDIFIKFVMTKTPQTACCSRLYFTLFYADFQHIYKKKIAVSDTQCLRQTVIASVKYWRQELVVGDGSRSFGTILRTQLLVDGRSSLKIHA